MSVYNSRDQNVMEGKRLTDYRNKTFTGVSHEELLLSLVEAF